MARIEDGATVISVVSEPTLALLHTRLVSKTNIKYYHPVEDPPNSFKIRAEHSGSVIVDGYTLEGQRSDLRWIAYL